MKITVVFSASNGTREEITVEASGKADAVYKAKQKFLETHSANPTLIGVKQAQDSNQMFTVDVEFKSGVCIKPQFLTQREAVAYAGRMAQDSAVKRSEVQGLMAKDAGRVTHTFGSRLGEANRQAKANSEISQEEWQRRFDIAKKKWDEAHQEGNRRKDIKGAFPKDVLRKMNAAQKEMDTARQYGKLGR